MSSTNVVRFGAAIRTASRRLRRFAFRYDALEHRQLLSVGQSVATASAALHNPVVQPTVSISPLFASSSPTGLTPAQVSNAYGLNQVNFGGVTGNGAGQTIAIIDASYDPNIASDLEKFDSQYGLQGPASFTQYVENGLSQVNSGWALETALDVEWAHAIAPAANIVLVEAQSDLNDLFSAVTFASNLPGVSVVSMSWGASEFAGESAYDSVFTTPAGHNGVTFVAASGDSGTTEYPSASPNVLSVGGTTLSVTSQGNYVSETPWSSTGTGTSSFESQPTYQAAAASAAGLASSGRTTPDVSFDANPATGVSVYDSIPTSAFGRTSWYTVGGTSVGAPSWAGLIAVADQGLALNGVGSLSNAQASLYQIASSAFNHPSTGTASSTAFAVATGLGSPKANLVVSALVQLNTPATKSTTPVVVPAKGMAATTPTHRNDITATTTNSGSTPLSDPTSIVPVDITALVPSMTSSSSTPTLVTVVIVPPPTPPVLLHLGSSGSPVLAQMIHSATEQLAEQPPSLNIFGQAMETELQRLFKPQLSPEPNAPPLIDVIEPFQPLDPADAAKGGSALNSGAVGGWQSQFFSPFAVDSVIESSNGGLFPLASLDMMRRARRRLGETKVWEFSTLFGAAVVATGGFHLAMRERARFKTRWLPSRAVSSLPTGRWPGFRGR